MCALSAAGLLSLGLLVVVSRPLGPVHPPSRVRPWSCGAPQQPAPHRLGQLHGAVLMIILGAQVEDGLQPLSLLQRRHEG